MPVLNVKGSLRIHGGASISTPASNPFASSQAAVSLSFFFRPNMAVPCQTGIVGFAPWGGYFVALQASGAINCQVGSLTGNYYATIGETYHVGIIYNSAGTSYFTINGNVIASATGLAAFSACNSSVAFNQANAISCDYHFANVAGWQTALSLSQMATLAGGANPLTVGSPYFASMFGGTYNATPTSGDTALANNGSGGVNAAFSVITLSGGTAVYSSDSLALAATASVGDAFISRTGSLAFFRICTRVLEFQRRQQ